MSCCLLCVWMGLRVIYGVFNTLRGQGGGLERWAEGWMERTAHSAEPLPKQSSFSPSPFIKFLLILTAPLPSFFLSLFSVFRSSTQYFLQIWGIIPIFPPSACESNLISLRSTPANLALMLQSCLRLLLLSYLSAALWLRVKFKCNFKISHWIKSNSSHHLSH